MAREYIEHKVCGSIDSPSPSGLLSTHIGIGLPQNDLKLVESPDINGIDISSLDINNGMDTLSARNLRGRRKMKSKSTHQFQEQNYATQSTEVTHPLSGSTSNTSLYDECDNINCRTCKHANIQVPSSGDSSSSGLKDANNIIHRQRVPQSSSKSQSSPSKSQSSHTVSTVATTQGSMYSVLDHVRQRFTNMSSYSNAINGVLSHFSTRRERSRSRSAGRNGSRTRARSNTPTGCGSFEEDFVFVETIELNHFDGLLCGSRREIGKGHRFTMLNLQSPTWCDYCGDFVWGVYKHCLRCQSK